jgi:hypothetical protein
LATCTLGKHYHRVRLNVEPGHVGFGRQTRRRRVYDVLVHRRTARMTSDVATVYRGVVAAFRKVNTASQPGAFLIAPGKEVAREAEYFARKRRRDCRRARAVADERAAGQPGEIRIDPRQAPPGARVLSRG